MALDDLKNMISNLNQFDWAQEQERILENNSDAIITLQEEQLYSGKDKNGDQITLEGRGYSQKTFEIKTEKGQPTDRITWRDSGALYAALQASIKDGQITFSAPGEKKKFNTMIERSGEAVIGLSEELRAQFAKNITLPAIKTVFKEKTSLQIS